MPDDGVHKIDLFGYLEQTQDTLFDRLNDAKIPWKIYYHDLPQSLVFWHQREADNSAKYFPIDDFYRDVQQADTFPTFTYIEPRYNGEDENDDHPPHDIMKAQKLIADVYNAIRRNEELWESTLLIILYDEHGGFYDHVEPPNTVPPDAASSDSCFKRLGVRVPALLVSPWVNAGVFPQEMDHTCFLKYLCDKWNLPPLGERVRQAKSFASVIKNEWDKPRSETPETITLTPEQLSSQNEDLDKAASKHKNANQVALIMLAHFLEIQADLKAPTVLSVFERNRWFLEPFFLALGVPVLDFSLVHAAQRSVTKFLEQKKKQAGEKS
jgi:phospholipase C